jgi:hypothetical protein
MLKSIFFYILQNIYQGYDSHFYSTAVSRNALIHQDSYSKPPMNNFGGAQSLGGNTVTWIVGASLGLILCCQCTK